MIVRGAREHNLKNITVKLPRDKFIVLTGISGSGKSSLAFDTIYAEGQRRYVESLSSYARQFLGQMEKPDVDSIDGLSPAISIDQKTTSRNPRSTVGTVTEIYDYLRLLYARIGIPHCPKCGEPIRQQSLDQMVEAVMDLGEGARIQILAPLVRGRKGTHQKVLEDMRKQGYVRARVDGEVRELSDDIALDKNIRHHIEVVIDRIIVRDTGRGRVSDSIETAMNLSGGLVLIDVIGGDEMLLSQNYACSHCGISIEELTPRMFSFNSPFGACPTCSGLGTLMRIDPAIIIPDTGLSIREGAIRTSGWGGDGSMSTMYLSALAKHYQFSLDTPVKDLPGKALDVILYGTGKEKIRVDYEREYGSGTFTTPFEGIVNNLERRYRETQSDGMKQELESYMSTVPCPDCGGERLRQEVRAVTVGELSLPKLTGLSIAETADFFKNLSLTEREYAIARRILREINARLGFLKDVGLSYLTLARSAASLSGGESQRIRLATQIGSALMGVIYILDEPSIGLHQRDNAKLLRTLERLRDVGNTLLVVEHDEDTMLAADHIVDVGPGAGLHGGEIVAQGTAREIMAVEQSVTGQYLSGKKFIPLPEKRRVPAGWLEVKNARENNLKNIDVKIPLGVFTCVTGVSGSGKSSLVNQILYKTLARDLNRARTRPGAAGGVLGLEHLDKVINIDQSPIGRTPRSNPATYTGLFDLVRQVFAATPDAKMRGYKNGRFSFNVKGGRCETCHGDGILRIEMHFLPDVYVPCEVCHGRRYNQETLEVRYKGKNIADVLDMTVEEAMVFFENLPRLKAKLDTLYDVGLGYVRLGQPSTTLSGGEAQRIKLATELSRRATGRTIYILDEPTTGLHIADTRRLVEILIRLTEGGNSVLVIEHNLDVIKSADYIIDLGPEGGDEGGTVVAVGTPEQLAGHEYSYTGHYLKRILDRDKRRQEDREDEQ
ncbi:MAG: excinuclease ABC subunit UvrA [Christensenellales bacterium]